jgi:hypothetical protein
MLAPAHCRPSGRLGFTALNYTLGVNLALISEHATVKT